MYTTLAEKVNPKDAALVVIDMQNDFCHPDGAGAKNGGDPSASVAMAPTLKSFIAEARKVGLPVIFVRFVGFDPWHFSDPWAEPRLKRQYQNCLEGSWGVDWYEVAPEPGDAIITKYRYSAFIGTDLDSLLRSRGIKSIILTGVGTNVCVECTARDGYQMDYYIVFMSDCTATSDPELHQATLNTINRSYGAVATSEEVIQVWAKQSVAAGVRS